MGGVKFFSVIVCALTVVGYRTNGAINQSSLTQSSSDTQTVTSTTSSSRRTKLDSLRNTADRYMCHNFNAFCSRSTRSFDTDGDAEAARKEDDDALDRKIIPVIYVYQSQYIPPVHYSWDTMRLTLAHGNAIVLITGSNVTLPLDLKDRILLVKQETLPTTTLLARFREIYQPWGQREPWERQNMERFFLLHEFMKKTDINYAFYADSDVAVLSQMLKGSGDDGTFPVQKCDAMVDIGNDQDKTFEWKELSWAVWSGSSVLNINLLSDFLSFATAMYEQPHRLLLELKNEKAKYVTDMTQWYLFVSKSNPDIGNSWKAQRESLPDTRLWRYCSGQTMGFDHQRAHERDGFKFEKDTLTASINGRPLRSIHFQGNAKDDVSKFLK